MENSSARGFLASHNCVADSGDFLANSICCALALGIPLTILFIYILISHCRANWVLTRQYRNTDAFMSELHCFVFVHIVALTVSILIGSDLNSPSLWFMLGIGLLAERIVRDEQRTDKGEAQNQVASEPVGSFRKLPVSVIRFD